MTEIPFFASYPSSFPSHSRDSAPVYRLRRGNFAAPVGDTRLAGRRALFVLLDEDLAVFEGTPPAEVLEGPECRPVYAFANTEPPAVPTGRVFVQVAPGTQLERAAATLGYTVESVPPYAPQAAWLVSSDRTIRSALANLEALMAASWVEAVEPQLLRPSASRPVPRPTRGGDTDGD